MTTLALLGAGAMGSRVARRLLAAGHTVWLYNRSPDKLAALREAGAQIAATPCAAAEAAEIVIGFVADDTASRAIWLEPASGALGALRAGQIAVESSTLSLDWTLQLSAAVQQRGAAFVDAPVVGSRPQADNGQLIHLVGGDTEAVEPLRALFASTSTAFHHLGAIGSGMSMKLVVNALFGIQIAALAELSAVLAKAGLPLQTALATIAELPIASPAVKGAAQLIANDQHAPLFPIHLVAKDLRYAAALAQGRHTPTPTLDTVRELFAAAEHRGEGLLNITGIARHYLSGAA